MNNFSIRVNGDIISSVKIDEGVGNYISELDAEGLEELGIEGLDVYEEGVYGMLKAEVSNRLVDKLLLFQHALEEGIVLDSVLLGEECERRRLEGTYSSYSGSELEELVRMELIIDLLERRLTEDLKEIGDDVLHKYYEENKRYFSYGRGVSIRHILIKSTGDRALDKESRHMAQGLLELLTSETEDFATLAKKYSDCESAKRGGELGYIYKGALGDEEFEEIIFSLEIRKPSGIFESKYGYHIVEVLNAVDNFTPSFLTVKDIIREILLEKVKEERREALIELLWERANIEYIGV